MKYACVCVCERFSQPCTRTRALVEMAHLLVRKSVEVLTTKLNKCTNVLLEVQHITM